jgi:hypothetical protein
VAAQKGRARHGEINEIAAFPSSGQSHWRQIRVGQICIEVDCGEVGAERAQISRSIP